jgi:hypothetical protein
VVPRPVAGSHVSVADLAAGGSQEPAQGLALPDFKHTVGYVKWWEDRVNGGITDDARPLWDELNGDEDASEETQETNHLLWGKDKEGAIPGLFTSRGARFDPGPWDPRDHPDWEMAYQSQEKHGLIRKLREAAGHRRFSTPARAPKDDFLTPAGFAPEDRLVLRSDSCALCSSMRLATKVLMQNAWRAPGGDVDRQSMKSAIITSLQIAAQARSRRASILDLLVAGSIQQIVTRNVLEALDKGALDAPDVAEIDDWLSRNNNQPLSIVSWYGGEVAALCDLLQFAYLPKDGVWAQPPQPNMENVKKLAGWARIMSDMAKQMPGILGETVVLNLDEEIGRSDPRTGVQQLVGLFLECRRISEQELPWDAVQHRRRVWKQFVADAQTHAISRQFLATFDYPELVVAGCEADRRATRIVFALHRHHNRTGKWPFTLGELRPILPASIRIDPFSGKPFVYRLENDQPLLYSAGYNAKDDGGTHVPYQKQEQLVDGKDVVVEADYVYWPVQREK